MRVRHAERRPGGGADDAVGAQAVVALEVAHGARRLAAEHSVRRDPETALEVGYGGAVMASAAAAAARTLRGGSTAVVPAGALLLEHLARVAHAKRRPRRRPDHAVGLQPVLALEGAHGVRGPATEYAVGGDAERALQRLHAAAVHAYGRRLRVGGGVAMRLRRVGRLRDRSRMR